MNRLLTALLLLSFCSVLAQDHQFKLVPLEFKPSFKPDAQVLFRDLPNYIRITANEGMSITDTIVTGASIEELDGQAVIRPFVDGKVEVTLHAIDKVSGRTAECVRVFETVSTPHVTIHNVKSDSMMTSLDCLLDARLSARIDGYYLPMLVDSFKMETVQNGKLIDLKASGEIMSKQMKQVIYDVDRSIELLFYDVWVSYGTGFPIRAQNYRVYVTEDDPAPVKLGIGVVR